MSNGDKIQLYGCIHIKYQLFNVNFNHNPTINKSIPVSLRVREERRLSVFENGVLGRIFGFKRDKVTGEWRKLHNEELKVLYSSLNIVRMIKT
jgi:hypothetical protein